MCYTHHVPFFPAVIVVVVCSAVVKVAAVVMVVVVVKVAVIVKVTVVVKVAVVVKVTVVVKVAVVVVVCGAAIGVDGDDGCHSKRLNLTQQRHWMGRCMEHFSTRRR